jgi:hypothetical protein
MPSFDTFLVASLRLTPLEERDSDASIIEPGQQFPMYYA